MNGRKTSIAKAFCLLFVASAAWAGHEHFPLEVGNSWAYRITQGQLSRPGTINVEARESIEGREYFRISFFEQTVHVRDTGDGNLVKYDRESGQELTWLPLAAAEGETVPSEMDQCSRNVKIASKAAEVKTLLGEFSNALELRYIPDCADAGITVQYFLPYVGMLVHETSSIAGPVRYELVYSRTGLTNIVRHTNAFTLATDSPVYRTGENAEMLARVTLRVTEPVELTFPSGQSTDLRIFDERGQVVYTWSADKLFPQVFRQEQVGPGERNWVMQVPLGNLAPGRYAAEGWLTTQPRVYRGVVTFEVVR